MAWQTAESKLDDLIILNQLRNGKTIFIEDNDCEVLDSNYIQDKKNKMSYRTVWSYLPNEVIEILYQVCMREYYSEKVLELKVPRVRNYDISNPKNDPENAWYKQLEQKASGKWGYPTKTSQRIRRRHHDRHPHSRQRSDDPNTCVCLTKKGKICGKKCMTNGWSLNEPFAEIDSFELRCCRTHKRVIDKMTPKQLKDEIAKIMLHKGYVEKHGIWCVAERS